MTYSRRQLYALGEPLGDAATYKAGGKVVYGSGGGGGGPSQQTITQSNIPDWLRPQVETVLGGAMQEMFRTQPGEGGKIDITGVKPYVPYSANPADYVAGFSPMQQQAMYGAANLQVPGQFGEASQMARTAGMGGLGAAGQAAGYGGMGADYGAQAAQLAGAAQRLGQSGAGYGGLGAGYGAQAAQLAGAAQRYGAQGAMGAAGVGAGVGSLARGYAAQQADAGRQYAGMATDPSSMQAYMSPYMQNVVDVQQQAAQRQADIANQAMQAKFAQSGAFGGARQGIQQAQAAADLARQKQGIQAQGLQNAFQQAQQAQQFGAGLGLQGLAGAQQGLGNILQGGQLGLQGAGMGLQGIGQAGQMYGLGMQGAGLGMRGAETGLQGIGQAGQMYGLGMQGAGLGLRGVETGLGGYNLLGQQAGMLGNLGTQELAARQGIIGTQAQMGGMEQQQQQNIINQAIQNYAQAQQYPLQTFNAYNALLRGYAVPGQTATTYQAAPSLPSQLAGLGMGAYGVSQLMKKKGGTVKAMAEGGVSEIDDKVRNNPTKYSEAQIKRSTANEIIDPQTAAMALAEIARARKAAAGINMLPSGLPAQGFAPGGIVAFEDGGKVERYQNQGLVAPPATPIGRWWERTTSDFAKKQEENRLRDMLRSHYQSVAAPVGGFLPVTDEERAAAKRLMDALPNMSVEQMRRLAQFDPGSILGVSRLSRAGLAEIPRVLNLEPSAAQAEAAFPSSTAAPTARPAPVGTDAYNFDSQVSGGAAPPAAGGVASLMQPRMTPESILAMAQKAGREAVPPGLAGPGLEQLTPENLRERQQAAMPQGEAAYRSELTPMQERLAQQTREAAEASREESKSIQAQLDKLRSSQEARYTAKLKDLDTDRNRSVGIAFLEAAQAMTQPGQTFLQGLTRSAAVGGKRLMEDRERLDAKAEKLADALERVDEARLGDRRERNAAETQYRNALLGVERELVNNAQTNYNMNKADAREIVRMGVERQVQAAGIELKQRELAINAEQGAARNAIAAAGVAQQSINQKLEVYEAALNNPRLAKLLMPQDKTFSELTDYIKANPQLAMQPPAKQIEAFMLAKQLFSPTVYSSTQPPANAIPYTPPAR